MPNGRKAARGEFATRAIWLCKSSTEDATIVGRGRKSRRYDPGHIGDGGSHNLLDLTGGDWGRYRKPSRAMAWSLAVGTAYAVDGADESRRNDAVHKGREPLSRPRWLNGSKDLVLGMET
jgi:hypothetical protein